MIDWQPYQEMSNGSNPDGEIVVMDEDGSEANARMVDVLEEILRVSAPNAAPRMQRTFAGPGTEMGERR